MKPVKERFRIMFQIVFMLITNGYLIGFIKGKLFKGDSKVICVPGLNCYSCPGAIGSCPVGSLQAALAGSGRSFPYYIIGLLLFFGVLLGRLVCGFMCPFGLVQDLLYKLKVPKVKMNEKVDLYLRYVKYIVLVFFVIIFPLTIVDEFGIGSPTFCKWICPSGTLFGGIPLVATNEPLRNIIGALFDWKIGVLGSILVVSTMVYRPFCKYLCPLGGFYGLFNGFSSYQMYRDNSRCTNCKVCEKACKMQVQVTSNINGAECIRCGVCKSVCPTQCIHSGFTFGRSLRRQK